MLSGGLQRCAAAATGDVQTSGAPLAAPNATRRAHGMHLHVIAQPWHAKCAAAPAKQRQEQAAAAAECTALLPATATA
jgi:hypothetical protein